MAGYNMFSPASESFPFMVPFDSALPGVPMGEAVPGGGGPSAPAPGRSRGSQFLDLIPQLLTAFGVGQAARQRDPQALSQIILDFARAQAEKKRGQSADEAQRLREQREARLADMAQNNEKLRLQTEAERERHAGVAEAHAAASSRSTAQNQIADDFRKTFFPEGVTDYNPTAMSEYINQQTPRMKDFGGDPAQLEALLMSIATNQSQRKPVEVPYIERAPGTPAPVTVAKGSIVRNAPTAKEPPVPHTSTFTDENQDTWRIVSDPKTGREISRTKVGKRPKPGSQQNDALDRIINEATGGGRGAGPGAAPGAAPPAHAKTPYRVGDVVTIKGKQVRVTALNPDGSYQGVPVK